MNSNAKTKPADTESKEPEKAFHSRHVSALEFAASVITVLY